MRNFKFSIVTVSYNQGQYIEENIKSIFNQEYDKVEHIIIDACSTDGTLDILKKYDHLNWTSEPDSGQSDGLNKGFKKAKGEIIGWINSDDMLCENSLEKVNNFFKANPKAIGVVGNFIIIDEKSKPIRTVYGREYTHDYVLNDAKGISQPATFFKREVFSKIGYLNENYHYAMDRDLFIRITSLDKIHYINEDLAYFRLQSDSKTSSGIYNFAKELIRMRWKYGGKIFSRGNLNDFYIILTEPLRRIGFLRKIVQKIKSL